MYKYMSHKATSKFYKFEKKKKSTAYTGQTIIEKIMH